MTCLCGTAATEQAPPPIQRTSALPFSFVYDGHSSDELLAVWPKKTARKKLDSSRTQHTLTWTDPRTGLEVRCVAVEYSDFPVAEWTVFLKNTGQADTPILENLQALDAKFERGAEGEFTLHGNKGDWCVPQSYEPYHRTLGPSSSNSLRARRRPPDQRPPRLALLQSADARGRPDLRHRLARAMGVLLHPRRPARPARRGGPASDPSVPEARRGNPHAAHRRALLEGRRHRPRAEPLAALVPGPQHPPHQRPARRRP